MCICIRARSGDVSVVQRQGHWWKAVCSAPLQDAKIMWPARLVCGRICGWRFTQRCPGASGRLQWCILECVHEFVEGELLTLPHVYSTDMIHMYVSSYYRALQTENVPWVSDACPHMCVQHATTVLYANICLWARSASPHTHAQGSPCISS